MIWFFPLYWALLTSIRTDQEAVAAGFDLWPDEPTLGNYIYVLLNSNIARWYLNSTITSVTSAGSKRPCSTTPGVAESRAASAAGSSAQGHGLGAADIHDLRHVDEAVGGVGHGPCRRARALGSG